MALHKGGLQNRPNRWHQQLATRNVDYHGHENEHNINIKPPSYITGLIREFQHINSTNTVGYYSIQWR